MVVQEQVDEIKELIDEAGFRRQIMTIMLTASGEVRIKVEEESSFIWLSRIP